MLRGEILFFFLQSDISCLLRKGHPATLAVTAGPFKKKKTLQHQTELGGALSGLTIRMTADEKKRGSAVGNKDLWAAWARFLPGSLMKFWEIRGKGPLVVPVIVARGSECQTIRTQIFGLPSPLPSSHPGCHPSCQITQSMGKSHFLTGWFHHSRKLFRDCQPSKLL